MKLKKSIGVLSIVPLLISGLSPTVTAAELPQPDAENSVVYIREVADYNWSSRREAITLFPDGGYDESYLCAELPQKTGPCAFQLGSNNNQFYGSNLLPVCESDTQEFCIESLKFINGQVDAVSAIHYGYAGGDIFPAVPSLGIYAGGQISLWSADGFSNSSGQQTYAVSVRSRQGYQHWDNRFVTTSVDFTVVPFQEISGDYRAPSTFDFVDEDGKNRVGGSGGGNCVWADEGKCGVRAEFVDSPTVQLVVRSDSALDGWFRGRMSETDIKVEKFSERNSRLTITGKVADLPQVAVKVPNAAVPKDLVSLLRLPADSSGQLNQSRDIGIFSTDGFQDKAFRVLAAFRDAAGDKSAGTVTTWALESINNPGNQKCFSDADGLVGVVTTNASVYEGTAPGFSNGQLTYRLAGLHFEEDGKTLNLGTYDLVMRSDVARCLYGFSRAPISATVEVVGTGDQSVATRIVSEKDGWLKLAAYGFTFSEKQVKVKLTQPQNKTLTKFIGSTRLLTSKQQTEIKAVVTKAKGNPKFICTGVYVNAKDKVTALKRARAACDYAKSLDKDHSYWAQAKQTKAKSYDGKVMVVSK